MAAGCCTTMKATLCLCVYMLDMLYMLYTCDCVCTLQCCALCLSSQRVVVRGAAYLLPQVPLLPWDASTISSMPEEVRAWHPSGCGQCRVELIGEGEGEGGRLWTERA